MVESILATIQEIESLTPIPTAENLLKLKLKDKGWPIVVRKDEGYKEGDLVIYVEPDSVLPEKPEFEFLRKSCYVPRLQGFRIRAITLRGQVSAGIVFPLSLADKELRLSQKSFRITVGLNLTEILGIRKYEKVLPMTQDALGDFPSFIPKTDEIDIENIPSFLQRFKELTFYASEKIDGCLDEKTLIKTELGFKTIREIYKNQYKGNIRSFDLFKSKEIWTKIRNYLIRENEPSTQWFELELSNGKSIKITGDHLIWLPLKKCWRRVDYLQEDDVLLLSENNEK